MEFLEDLLKEIKKRPGMFLGKKSLLSLHSFLAGYMMARLDMGLSTTKQEQKFNDFAEWIPIKFNDNSTRSWAGIILLNSEDESQAFDRFFELLEEFKNLQSKQQ